jgi:hypothetical protein
MLIDHAIALTEARSHVAALADRARSVEASSAYEHVLFELDWLHDDDVPALDTTGLPHDRGMLLAVATAAIEGLIGHGIDALRIELVLAALDGAWDLDAT